MTISPLPRLGAKVRFIGKFGVNVPRVAFVTCTRSGILPNSPVRPISSDMNVHLVVLTPGEVGQFSEFDVPYDSYNVPGTWSYFLPTEDTEVMNGPDPVGEAIAGTVEVELHNRIRDAYAYARNLTLTGSRYDGDTIEVGERMVALLEGREELGVLEMMDAQFDRFEALLRDVLATFSPVSASGADPVLVSVVSQACLERWQAYLPGPDGE